MNRENGEMSKPIMPKLIIKGSVREKLKGLYAQCDKKALLIATNLTSICCVYKEKIVKDVSFHFFANTPFKYIPLTLYAIQNKTLAFISVYS